MKRLERAARRVAPEVARILNAEVRVLLDEQVVGTSEAPGPTEAADAAPPLKVSWSGEAGSIDVAIYPREQPIAAQLAEAVVALVVEHDIMVESLSTSDEMKDRLLHDLLLEDSVEPAEARRLSRLLGLNLDRPRSVLLIDASAYVMDAAQGRWSESNAMAPNPQRVREVIAAVAWFFSLPDETICVHLQGGLIGILKACTTADLLQWSESGDGASSWADLGALKRAASEMLVRLQQQFGTRIDVAVGRYHPGLSGLHASYQDCRLALKLGRARRPGKMHSLDELGLSALLVAPDDGTKQSLASRLVGPLLCEPDMLSTLRAFFAANCSSNVTAQDLAIHRNTLGYRLDKITAMTGLDPRVFNDAMQLRISLELMTSNF